METVVPQSAEETKPPGRLTPYPFPIMIERPYSRRLRNRFTACGQSRLFNDLSPSFRNPLLVPMDKQPCCLSTADASVLPVDHLFLDGTPDAHAIISNDYIIILTNKELMPFTGEAWAHLGSLWRCTRDAARPYTRSG